MVEEQYDCRGTKGMLKPYRIKAPIIEPRVI
jgi:hypothetical protein